MKKISLKSIVWKEEKHYVAQCLNVDVSSFGSTKKAAESNLKEALELYFEGNDFLKKLTKVGTPVPFETSLYA
jgi:predicted RNase H-like HicB family nuclease